MRMILPAPRQFEKWTQLCPYKMYKMFQSHQQVMELSVEGLDVRLFKSLC